MQGDSGNPCLHWPVVWNLGSNNVNKEKYMPDTKDNDELETKIANLIIDWSIEVQNMPRGKTVSVWCMDDIMHLISTHVVRARNELEQEYDGIFKWMLGEAGDFPISEPGRRYNWRPELRERLTRLKSQRKGEE